MNGLSFANPLLLLGLAAAALPVLIHLFDKRKLPVEKLPTLRFLLQANEQVKRRIRLRDILLVALRTLAVMLLALLVARPFWQEAGAAPSLTSDAQSVIFVLDGSFGMKYRGDNDETLFERAVERVRRDVAALEPGKSAALVVCDDRWRHLTDEIGAPGSLLPRLSRAEAGDFAVDWGRCLQDSIALAASSPQPGVEIRVYTNLVAGPWEAASLPASGTRDVRLNLVDVAGRDLPNRALTRLSVARTYGIGGARWTANIAAASHGVPAETVGLRLQDAEGGVVAEGLVDFDEWGVREKLLDVSAGDREAVDGVARIEADGLPDDDELPFRFYFGRPVRVLIVDGAPGSYAEEADSYFLATALRPGKSPSNVEPRVLTRTMLRPEDLQGIDVVFLLNTGSLPNDTLRLLTRFTEAGGGLFLAVGDHLTAADFSALGALSPGRLRTIRDLRRPGQKAVGLKSFPGSHPLFDELTLGSLATARFTAFAQIENLPADAEVLLEFADGSPSLVSYRHGRGRVLWFASTLDADWNNFPYRPFYLPIVHQSVRFLGGILHPPMPPVRRVGESVTLDLAGEKVGIVRPDGRTTERTGDTLKAPFTDTRAAGRYQVVVDGRRRPEADFFMRRDPAVSDLRRMPAAELEARLGEAGLTGTVQGASTAAKPPVDPVFVLLGLLGMLLTAESVLAQRRR